MTVVSADGAKQGHLLDPGEGEAFWLLGMLEVIKIGRKLFVPIRALEAMLDRAREPTV